jgi:hypothetical protein
LQRRQKPQRVRRTGSLSKECLMTEATKPSKGASAAPAEQAKNEAAKKPSPGDVHEQREAGQQHEGVVTPPARPATLSQVELERAAGEGMTAPPSEPKPAAGAIPAPAKRRG